MPIGRAKQICQKQQEFEKPVVNNIEKYEEKMIVKVV